MPNPIETAPRDENGIPTRLAVLNTDTIQGEHLVPLAITDTGLLKINSTSTISFTPVAIDPRDQNYVGCWLFQGLNGEVYPAVADASGALLVDI